MSKQKAILLTLIASALANVILIAALCTSSHRLRAFKAQLEDAGLTVTNAIPAAASQEASETDDVDAVTNTPPRMKVLNVSFNGRDTFDVRLSQKPDMNAIRRYVDVGPLANGVAGFSLSMDYGWDGDHYVRLPRLTITGDFAYRTNVTLRIRQGLPNAPKSDSDDEYSIDGMSLEKEWSGSFAREDAEPAVRFASKGRYLPPGGSRSVAVEAVNVTNVFSEIRRVEPRNIVQLLAREEDMYIGWGMSAMADSEHTKDLSGEMSTNVVRCQNVPNVREKIGLPVLMDDGGPSRGVYLVTIRSADYPSCDWRWSGGRYNPERYRLVCVSDLAASVRLSGDDDSARVWVTSLTTGAAVTNAQVEIYSSANILIAGGVTDASGLCAPVRVAKGKPFAVVVRSASGDDMSFIALQDSSKVDETPEGGVPPKYLAPKECNAFVWTERGIYRHGEKIFLHAIIRDGTGNAPAPFPAEVVLVNPEGYAYSRATITPDANGVFSCDAFSVPAEQPSGKWELRVKTPGKDGSVLGWHAIRIEEFAPPQIRVAVKPAEACSPTNFSFTVSAEHLYGGPARALAAEGIVVFEDAPFEPKQWKGFRFGNEDLGLAPSFRRLKRASLDERGECVFEAPLLPERRLPKAAVLATGQGTVFESGGRPAVARASATLHYYPYYIGTSLPNWLKKPEDGKARISLVCVTPDGAALTEGKKLSLMLEQIETVYSYRVTGDGWGAWDATTTRMPVADATTVESAPGGPVEITLPTLACGDYFLTITDTESGVSFGRSFYLSDYGSEAISAPLSNPTKVTLTTDKEFYRPGETPRLLVKSPFAGLALVGVFRDKEIYSEVVALTNATSEISLRKADASWAPNVDVRISVVQGVDASAKRLAARAHGEAAVRVRRPENEISVSLEAAVRMSPVSGGNTVDVAIGARGAGVSNAWAVVTVVDEGINLLTGGNTVEPIDYFARLRTSLHPLHDLFHLVLPVLGDGPGVAGVKTGGDDEAGMLSRVSPVPTRRFRPLAMWKAKVPVVNGLARTSFALPEFTGEIRVTAVAYTSRATGSATLTRKVAPKLIMQPDAPRFVAPKDEFEITLPISNRSGGDGQVAYGVAVTGAATMEQVSGAVFLPDGASTNLFFRARGAAKPGEAEIAFHTIGFGETHASTIALPVRPAAAWRAEAGVERLEPGSEIPFPADGSMRRSVVVSGSPMGDLVVALDWLADYPHGCLEQTASRIFPLITAGGILNALGGRAATNRAEYVEAGVRRVESMVRENDFVMWPDCNYPPWDSDVSLYAAHFLVEAEKAGTRLNATTRKRVMSFLERWAASTNTTVSAYACHTLAIAGKPDRDRMFRLYDARQSLSLLSRARLARAFAALPDLRRAETLLENAATPSSVKEASFALLALLETNPQDARVTPLLKYIESNRDDELFCWGTTESNAHALLAIGEYYRRNPVQIGNPSVEVRQDGKAQAVLTNRKCYMAKDAASGGSGALRLANTGRSTAFLSWSAIGIPDPSSVTNESHGISIRRRILNPDGVPADMGEVRCGDLLIVELTLTTEDSRDLSDLVVEDLLPGAFEPIHSAIDRNTFQWCRDNAALWVMRSDARDDRVLVFSRKFHLEKGHEAKFHYQVRAVSAGDFALPAPSVEAMYNPALRARGISGGVVVRH